MRILFCSVEVSPFAKVGGLADVAGSLPKSLVRHGHEVVVMMPAYGMVVNDPKYKARKVVSQQKMKLRADKVVSTDLWEIIRDGVRIWLVDGDGVFAKVSKSQEVYTPQRDDYLFYGEAALRMCMQLEWMPDVVHCNDWHTSFTPVFMREKYPTEWKSVGAVFTIHNLAYQGEFGPNTVEAAGLPTKLFNPEQLETFGLVNFLKSGCVYSDQVNTVSPTYAKEIQTAEFGCNLHGLMLFMAQHGKLRGILNGIDNDFFNPGTDPHIPAHFSAKDISGKERCRTDLCHELGLPIDSSIPIAGMVSRLSNQKGYDLIVAQAKRILDVTKLVVLGTGDPSVAADLRRLEKARPDRIKFVEAFDEPLAQRIYAGCDMFLMPSRFEPCGLGQIIALRYGTIPVVRRTGGLADTVFDEENGFVMESEDSRELAAVVERSSRAYRNATRWEGLVRKAMSIDHGWNGSSADYVRMYEDAIAARQKPVKLSRAV